MARTTPCNLSQGQLDHAELGLDFDCLRSSRDGAENLLKSHRQAYMCFLRGQHAEMPAAVTLAFLALHDGAIPSHAKVHNMGPACRPGMLSRVVDSCMAAALVPRLYNVNRNCDEFEMLTHPAHQC